MFNYISTSFAAAMMCQGPIGSCTLNKLYIDTVCLEGTAGNHRMLKPGCSTKWLTAPQPKGSIRKVSVQVHKWAAWHTWGLVMLLVSHANMAQNCSNQSITVLCDASVQY